MPVLELGDYKHHKGHIYTVLHLAEHTETGEHIVIYKSHFNEGIWARPLWMFNGTIKNQSGEMVKRFTKV